MIYFYDNQMGQIRNMGKFDTLKRAKLKHGRQWFWVITRNGIALTYPCNRYEFHMITKD